MKDLRTKQKSPLVYPDEGARGATRFCGFGHQPKPPLVRDSGRDRLPCAGSSRSRQRLGSGFLTHSVFVYTTHELSDTACAVLVSVSVTVYLVCSHYTAVAQPVNWS